MGCCFEKFPEEPRIYSKKSSIELRQWQGSLGCCDFQFTSKTVNQTNAQCLLIFVDPFNHLQNNVFLRKLGEHASYKLQEYLDVYLEAHSLGIGQYCLVNVNVPEINAKKIAFLCLNVWNQEVNHKQDNIVLKKDYQVYLEHALFGLLLNGIRNLAITQFNPQFGIPIQSAEKIMGKTLVFHGSGFRIISIICENNEARDSQEQAIKRYHTEYEKLIENGFSFQNSKGSIINILSPYIKSLSSNYL